MAVKQEPLTLGKGVAFVKSQLKRLRQEDETWEAEAFDEFLAHMKEPRSAGKVTPSVEQANVEKTFPAIAKLVQGYGHIEIGDQDSFGFVVRALDYGGLVFEDDKPDTLAEAMATLEKRLAEYFVREGIE